MVVVAPGEKNGITQATYSRGLWYSLTTRCRKTMAKNNYKLYHVFLSVCLESRRMDFREISYL